MRVLMANSFFYPALGGIENYILNVGRCLTRWGHQVTVLARQHKADLPLTDTVDGFTVYRYPHGDKQAPWGLLDTWRQVRACRRAARALLQEKTFDWVVLRDTVSLAGVLPLIDPRQGAFVQPTAAPLFIRAAYSDMGSSWKGKSYHRLKNALDRFHFQHLERRWCMKCGKRVVLSRSMRDEICDFYGFPKDSYQVIPAGVDTTRFVPVDADRKRELRQRLGLPERAFLFLFVGRASREKNPSGAVDAFSLLPPVPPTALVMIGPLGEEFRRKARVSFVPGPVIFPGACPEPVEYFQAADALIFPSLGEGFGQVLPEAMAAGLPCIAFGNPTDRRVLATEEIIEDRRTGILCEYGDSRSLSNAMAELASDPQRAQRMGEAGRERCERFYRWEAVTAALLQRACRVTRSASDSPLREPVTQPSPSSAL